MEGENDSERRIAALCKCLGRMWSARKTAVMDGIVLKEKLTECHLTLFGHLLTNANVNFQAFLNTMRKAWKAEHGNQALGCSHSPLHQKLRKIGF